jgi:putative ABC transport system ATP-binding protein
MIKLTDITKTYLMGMTRTTVLHGITLQIKEGEMLAIMGPSGSGKSSLMNIIGLLDRPSSGSYYLLDREVIALSDDELALLRNLTIGFVFQQFFLLPRLTAEQNVLLPLRYRAEPVIDAHDKVRQMLDKVGMLKRAHHRPNQLSGGQQQRVAIARALVTNPAMILADEPTGALDSHTGAEILRLFHALHDEEGRTIVVVTHDPKIGAECERIVNISDGLIVDA